MMGNRISAILTRGGLGALCALVALAAVGAVVGYRTGVGARPNVPPGVRGAVVSAFSWLVFFWPVAAALGFLGGCLAGLAIEGIKSAATKRRQ